MKYLKYIGNIVVLGVLCIAVISCSKDRIEEDKNEFDEQSLNEYFELKKQEEQVFIISDTGSGPIICKQGTKLWVGPDILQYPNGDSVIYPCTLKVVELYSAKDMIYYQMPSVSNGTIMETDCELRIRAEKDGTELELRPGRSLRIHIPSSNPLTDRTLYYGEDGGSFVNWVSTPVTSVDTIGYGYETNMQKLGWVNCGRTVASGSNHVLKYASVVDDLTNVGIFAYVPDHHSVVQAYQEETGNIPDGLMVKSICFAVDAGGTIYKYEETTTLSSTINIDVVLNATTEADLDAALDNL